MAEPCNCDQALALKAENTRLREYGRGIIEAGGDVARERDALKAENAALRELAGELLSYVDETDDPDGFFAKAKSLGVEGGND